MQGKKGAEQTEQKLYKKMELLEELVGFFEKKASKKKLSEYDNIHILIKETIWLSRVKNEMPEMIGEMNYFGDLELIPVEVRTVEEQFEQLSLPGIQDFESEMKKKKEKLSADMFSGRNCFIKHQGTVHMAEMLALHDKKTLGDISRYVMQPVPARAKQKELAELISKNICENPVHLLPCMTPAAISRLLCFAELEEESEVVIDENTLDEYLLLMMWGLLSVEIIRKDGNVYFVLDVPEEVKKKVIPVFSILEKGEIEGKEIAGYLDGEKTYTLKELYEKYDEMFVQIKKILLTYGVIEEDTLFGMYKDLTGMDCEEIDFKRFLYLRGTFHTEWTTGQNILTKQRVVGIDGTMIARICERRNEQVTDYFRYQNFQELNSTLQNNMKLWEPVYKTLSQWELEPDELGDYVLGYHAMFTYGDSLSCVMEQMMDDFDTEDVMDVASLWRALVAIYMNFPCYPLKGYSRIQAEEKFGVERYYGVFEVEEGNRIAKAMLYELPEALQKQLADMVLLSNRGMYEELKEKERLLEGKYRSNPAVKTVLTMNVVEAYSHLSPQVQKQKEEEVRKRVEEWSNDIRETQEQEMMTDWCESMGLKIYKKNTGKTKKILVGDEESGMYYWDEIQPEIKPVVKKDKVYPNDPCPCGSGKKYKKCCGRK